jgi:ABC-type Fe3+/spermidine/putrescine transport system ATPase subunit
VSKVELLDVTKRFGKTTAVAGLNLTVEEGEFLSLVGPSGCGKTTTLRLIAGFIRPDSGKVLLGGSDFTHVGVRKRNIGIVFQNYALFPNMNAYENVAFGLKARKTSPEKIFAKVSELLEMVGLSGKAESFPDELSGGQQQRIALARALAIEPKVLLLDEPLSALDAKVRNNLRLEIKRIQRESGITTVYVTHDQEEALAISDRVALMNKGAIEQTGTPGEIYSRPASLFSADFVGVNNIIQGEYLGSQEFKWKGGIFRVTDKGSTCKGPCYLLIRPEKLKTEKISEKPVNTIEGTCLGKVFLGPLVRLAVQSGGQTFLVDMLNEQAGEVCFGETLTVHFDPDDALLLER